MLILIFGSAPCSSRTFISAVSLDCAARTNAVAPASQNHCIVKIVRVSVFSFTRAFGSAPFSQQQNDQIEVVHVRLRHRVVAPLDVAVVRREIERRPSTLVCQVHVRATFDQNAPRGDSSCCSRRSAAASSRKSVCLIHVRARVEERPCRFEVPFARREAPAQSDRRHRCRPGRSTTTSYIVVFRLRRGLR